MNFDEFRRGLERDLGLEVWGSHDSLNGALYLALHEPGPMCNSMMVLPMPANAFTEELRHEAGRALATQAKHLRMVRVH